MIKKVSLFFCMLILSSCASQSTRNKYNGSYINTDAIQALKAYEPNFYLWPITDFMPSVRKLSGKKNPGVTSGDFNGDNIEDYAVLGHNKTHEFLLAVISQKQTDAYKVYRIDKATRMDPRRLSRLTSKNKREFGIWTYLSILSPSKIKSKYERKVIELKNDALEVKYFEKGSLVYFFNKNKFQKYISTRY